MPMLRDWPSAHRMRVIKVLGVALRVIDLPIGVMPPLRDCRLAQHHLAENVTLARGEVPAAIRDDRGCRGHPFDFSPTYQQTCSQVLARQAAILVNER